jgi:hypothetical protein
MLHTLDKPTARRHHYLPQGYLAGFTDTGAKDGQSFVLEVEYGTFEDPLRPVVRLKPAHVAIMNRRVAVSAERHVYSDLPAFEMWHEGQVTEVGCQPGK